MTIKREGAERLSLARWSRRKLQSAVQSASTASSAVPAVAPSNAAAAAPADLPPIESLHFDSDFTAFLRPEVDEAVKRSALKQLFRDPRFNVMDGLDVYIDDYTKADPIPPDMLAQLVRRFDQQNEPPAPATAGAPDSAREHTASSGGTAAEGDGSSAAAEQDTARDESKDADPLAAPAAASKDVAGTPQARGSAEAVSVDPTAARDAHR